MIKKALIAGALLGFSTVTMAGPSQGDWEIIFTNMGGFVADVEDADTQYQFGAEVGYFFTNRHELGFGVIFADDGVDEMLSLEALYRYNFVNSDDKKWWYVGADLVLPNADEEFAKPTYLRPNVGHKWMLSDDIAFDINAGYAIGVQDAEFNNVEFDAPDMLDVEFGFSIFF